MESVDILEAKGPKPCFFCNENESKYSCPRCNEHYCSMDCYKCERHAECSESFYRDCVTEELASYPADSESKKKMMEILNKFHNDGLQEPPEFNSDESDSGNNVNSDNEELDSDDEVLVDLEERIADVNLDDPEAVWNALNEDERNEFEALISGGDVSKLVPIWVPWWSFRKESKLVEEVKQNTEEEEAMKACPRVKDVPELTTISKTEPADCVKYNIINVIASYAFVLRYFNGESGSTEFVPYLLSVSRNLANNSNFDDEETAVASVQQECINSTIIETDNASLQVMKHDVYLILRGPSKEHQFHYCNAALSDVYKLFSGIKQSMKKKTVSPKHESRDEPFSKKFPTHGDEHLPGFDSVKIKNCLKKIEYYLSYTKSYGVL